MPGSIPGPTHPPSWADPGTGRRSKEGQQQGTSNRSPRTVTDRDSQVNPCTLPCMTAPVNDPDDNDTDNESWEPILEWIALMAVFTVGLVAWRLLMP